MRKKLNLLQRINNPPPKSEVTLLYDIRTFFRTYKTLKSKRYHLKEFFPPNFVSFLFQNFLSIGIRRLKI